MQPFKLGDWVLPNIKKVDALALQIWAPKQFGPNLNIPLQLAFSNSGGVFSKQKGWLLNCDISDTVTLHKYLILVKNFKHKLLEIIKEEELT